MRAPPLLLAIFSIAPLTPARSQTTEYLIDFGDETLPTGAQVEVWNDLHPLNWLQPLPLVDSAGNATPVSLVYVQPMGRADPNGVQVPDPGSALEQLGWPLTAIGDSIGSDTLASSPEMLMLLSGLDPQATYDVTLVGSVLESGISLATEYTTFGEDSVATLGEIAQNTSEVQRLTGIRPRADGTLDLRVRNATTNTSYGRRYYLNAASLVEHPPGTQPLILGFDANRLDVGRVAGKGPVQTSASLYTSDGSVPQVNLSLIDTGTGIEPGWMAVPATAAPGAAFNVLVDVGGLAPQTYTAELTANADGYVSHSMQIVLVVRDPGRLNLLYYGNSYTAINGSVNVLVDLLAEEAGLDPPAGVPRLYSGKNLAHHLNSTQVLAISRSLPLGEEWDFVILQGGTVEAAATVGSPAQFVADGLAILANVRAHSPQVRALVFQTWARAAGHYFYQGSPPTYPGPLDMHLELEDGNRQLAAAIENTYGAGTATVAAAGETSALRGFDPAIYMVDLSHPGPELTAQAALTVFSAMYGLAVCDLTVDFDSPGALASHLVSIGLDQQSWQRVAGIGDRAGAPELRKYPGSGEDFLLTSGAPGSQTACSLKSYPAGAPLRFELTSPAGSVEGLPALIYFDRSGHSGGATVVPPWPEAHYTSSAWIQAWTTALGPGGLATELALPIELVGHTLLIQGFSESASANTGHAFSFSDAHAVHALVPQTLPAVKKKP